MPNGSSEISAIFFGLACAACWGASDFSGGVAAKRGSAYLVVLASQLVGIAFLGVLLVPFSEPLPSFESLLWGAAAGLSGGLGLVAFYRALADGRMGVVAPLAGVVGALVPVVITFLLEGPPPPVQLAGFGVALTAVWLISSGGHEVATRLRGLALPVAAGLGFGGFFVLFARASETAVLLPLVAARAASIVMMFVVTLLLGQLRLPDAGQMPFIVLTGVFDTGANALFALAARGGRLDIAAVLGSLYPGGTVLLAAVILKERLARLQWLGVAAALVAIALIAA